MRKAAAPAGSKAIMEKEAAGLAARTVMKGLVLILVLLCALVTVTAAFAVPGPEILALSESEAVALLGGARGRISHDLLLKTELHSYEGFDLIFSQGVVAAVRCWEQNGMEALSAFAELRGGTLIASGDFFAAFAAPPLASPATAAQEAALGGGVFYVMEARPDQATCYMLGDEFWKYLSDMGELPARPYPENCNSLGP